MFFPTGGLSGQKSSGVSHNTAAVVGLSLLLLVLLLILAQMYKNHQRVKICSIENYQHSKTNLTLYSILLENWKISLRKKKERQLYISKISY